MPLTVRANLATQWQGFNGNVTAPMYSFSSAPGSGMFHAGNQQIGLSVNGTEVAQVTTQGLVVKAGSNVAPSLTFAGNTSTGVYLSNTNTISLATAGTERVRVDQNGNVGIGTGTPKYTLDIGGFSANTNTFRIATASTGNSQIKFMEQYDTDTHGFTLRNISSSRFSVLRHSGNVIGTEVMSINRDTGQFVLYNSSGGPLFALNSDAISATLNLITPDQNGGFQIYAYNSENNRGTFLDALRIAGGYVFRHAGSDVMYLAASSTMTGFQGLTLPAGNAQKPGGGSWASYSDRRLKANIEQANVDQCYEIVKSLPLQRFEFIPEYVANTSVQDTNVVGWIADDVQEVFPKAVTITKAFGMDDVKTLDVDQLYKTMWGAVSKLIQENDSLKARVEALENP